MTESKLNPFDAELLVMIGDIAKRPTGIHAVTCNENP